MISSLFIFNPKGDVLLARHYKNDVRKNVHEVFRIQVINSPVRFASADARSPVLTLGSTSFLSVRSGPLWLVAVARSNQDASLIFEYLYELDSLLRRLFARGAPSLSESDVTNNFVAIYEILSESVDFGFPTSLDLSHLVAVVPSLAGLKPAKESKLKPKSNSVDSVDSAAVPWRQPGIKHRKNEVFVDIEEKLNILMDGKGKFVRSNIDGAVSVKSCLSGMPVCRLGFSEEAYDELLDDLSLDNFKFHKCVDVARYNSDKCIQFVPPDGSFQLMTYHIEDAYTLPFDVQPQLTVHGSIVTLAVRLMSEFTSKSAAANVVLKVDVPRVNKHKVTSSNGEARFDAEQNAILWTFSRFYGDSEHLMTADFEVPENALTFFKPKISIDFTLDSYNASGLAVKYLKVSEPSGYKTVKWINYCTKADSYEVRL